MLDHRSTFTKLLPMRISYLSIWGLLYPEIGVTVATWCTSVRDIINDSIASIYASGETIQNGSVVCFCLYQLLLMTFSQRCQRCRLKKTVTIKKQLAALQERHTECYYYSMFQCKLCWLNLYQNKASRILCKQAITSCRRAGKSGSALKGKTFLFGGRFPMFLSNLLDSWRYTDTDKLLHTLQRQLRLGQSAICSILWNRLSGNELKTECDKLTLYLYN